MAVKLIFNYKSFNDVTKKKKKIPVQDAFVNYISTKLGRKIKMLCKEKESYSVDDYLISQLTKIILCLFFGTFDRGPKFLASIAKMLV